MRNLSAIFTLAVVVSFTVVPYFTEWHPHYLGDRAEEVEPRTSEGDTSGSVHYKNCHWLAGIKDVEAALIHASHMPGFEGFSPCVPLVQRPCFSSLPPAFSSRAPPPVLS